MANSLPLRGGGQEGESHVCVFVSVYLTEQNADGKDKPMVTQASHAGALFLCVLFPGQDRRGFGFLLFKSDLISQVYEFEATEI